MWTRLQLMTTPEYLSSCKAERAIIIEIRAHISPLPFQAIKPYFSSPEFLTFRYTVPLKPAWLFLKHTSKKKKSLHQDTAFHPLNWDFQGDPSSEVWVIVNEY